MLLSQEYMDFKIETDVSVPYLHTPGTRERLLIPESRVVSIDTHKADFDAAYDEYLNPTKHTNPTIMNIKKAYKIFRPEMNGLKKQLKAHLDVKLLGADYGSLYIHKDSSRRRKVPAPKFAPHNSESSRSKSVVQIFTSNPNPPHDSAKSRPVDVAKIGRKMAIVAFGAPEPTQDKYITLDTTGSVSYKLIFKPEDKGKEAWLITWYISPSGESGPPSIPLSFIIT